MGRDTSEGSDAKTIIDDFTQRMLAAASTEDFNAVKKDLHSHLDSLVPIAGSENWMHNDLFDSKGDEYKRSYWYLDGLKKTVTEAFDYENQTTVNAKLLHVLNEMLVWLEKSPDPIPEKLQSDFLLLRGILPAKTKQYGSWLSDEMMSKYGFIDGHWTPTEYQVKGADGQMRTSYLTAEESKKTFKGLQHKVQEAIAPLSPNLKAQFDNRVNHKAWSAADKEELIVNHDYWNENKQIWETFLGYDEWRDGNYFIKAKHQPKFDGEGNPIRKNHPNDTTTEGDYQSNYKSNSAAPKQIIVKIENLMNVKSIDLTNPQNQAVVSDLKEQLAQALIDVVHDFDASFHS
jgi:hypothetical protein